MLLLDKKITENLYDVIILGGGVAGLAAAITSGQLGLQTLVLEKAVLGGSVAVLESVSDYPGIEKIGGWELTQTMVKQAQKAGCQLLDSIEVTGVTELAGSMFAVKCSDGNNFQARSVIVTTGGQPRMLGLDNEARFARKGIHTCAQCAGPRYKDKGVAVAGNGSWAVEAALHLLSLGCRVTFITGDAKMIGNVILIDKLLNHKHFCFMGDSHIEKLRGIGQLEEIDLVSLHGGENKCLPVAAVFVYRGIVPNIKIVAAQQDAKGFLLVDENYMTSLPGMFATGRVVYADLPIQVLVGDGSRTALSAAAWLQADA
ncbi:MAG: NAD(P)/FAD-dependent oxidoreductase [Desulfobulbales bacterium]